MTMRAALRRTCAAILVMAFAVLPSFALADVYQDRQLTQNEAFSLTRLLGHSVTPGGSRQITINGNPLLVKRHALPGRDKGTAILDGIEAGYESSFDHSSLPLLDPDLSRPDRSEGIAARYDSLDSLVVTQAPTEAVTSEADRMVAEERAAIVAQLERPFRYRAGIWDIYARIPVAALKPDSVLVGLPASDGFIYMAELSPDKSQGYWEIRFGDNFHLGAILSDHKGDAPGYDPPLERFPGTRRTLTYEEQANNWISSSWSFEGRGRVAEQSEHYVRQYEQMGFVRKAIGANDDKEVMVQMARGSEQAVVYVVNTGQGQRPVQVTIQQSRNPS